MASPRFEVPVGLIDGVNKVFVLSMPYGPGATALFRNGILQERSLDDGWVETNPDTGVITLKEAPLAIGQPDVIQVFFLDRQPSLPEASCVNLRGVIRMGNRSIKGMLTATTPIRGYIRC